MPLHGDDDYDYDAVQEGDSSYIDLPVSAEPAVTHASAIPPVAHKPAAAVYHNVPAPRAVAATHAVVAPHAVTAPYNVAAPYISPADSDDESPPDSPIPDDEQVRDSWNECSAFAYDYLDPAQRASLQTYADAIRAANASGMSVDINSITRPKIGNDDTMITFAMLIASYM